MSSSLFVSKKKTSEERKILRGSHSSHNAALSAVGHGTGFVRPKARADWLLNPRPPSQIRVPRRRIRVPIPVRRKNMTRRSISPLVVVTILYASLQLNLVAQNDPGPRTGPAGAGSFYPSLSANEQAFFTLRLNYVFRKLIPSPALSLASPDWASDQPSTATVARNATLNQPSEAAAPASPARKIPSPIHKSGWPRSTAQPTQFPRSSPPRARCSKPVS